MTYEQYSLIATEILGPIFSLDWGSFRKKPVAELQQKYGFQPRKVAIWAQLFAVVPGIVSCLVVLPFWVAIIILHPFRWLMDLDLPYIVAIIPLSITVLIPLLIVLWLTLNPMVMWLLVKTGIVTVKDQG